MSEFAMGLLTLACVCAGALAGLCLRRAVPEQHLREASKDVVRLVSGLLAMLAALVLGLLIASTKGAYDQVSDAQRHALSRVRQLVDELTMERWLTLEKAHGSVPPGLLVVLVSWLVMMFASFGLFSPRNATTLTALFIGALAVSTSIFLIEEMSRPFEGWFALSGETMSATLAVLGR